MARAISATGGDALGIDWTVDSQAARRDPGARVALQGNLDPCALHATPATIRAEVARVLAATVAGAGHVFNLGHGIHPDVDPENVAAMVAAVWELSPGYHTRPD